MRKAILSILGGAIFLLPLMFASCGNIDNPLEILDTSGSGGGGGGSEGATSDTYKVWNGTEFVDTKIPTGAIEITNSTTTFGEGTYFVKGNVTLGNMIFTGDAEIILCDGATLTVNGLFESESNDLPPYMKYDMTVYGQENNSGKLIVSIDDGSKSIWFKKLTIHGGDISATSESDGIAAEDVLTIFGGKITANGGGGGQGISAKDLDIYGGTITANGAACMEGILVQNTVTIKGGTVNANGGDGKAAAGGQPAGGDGLQASAVDVQGGSLTAIGGNGEDGNEDHPFGGKGGNGIAATVKVSGSATVIATGGKGGDGKNNDNDGDGGNGGIGIDGNLDNASPNVTITGGDGGDAGTPNSGSNDGGAGGAAISGTVTGSTAPTTHAGSNGANIGGL